MFLNIYLKGGNMVDSVDLNECTVKFYRDCLVVNPYDLYSCKYIAYSEIDSIKLEER